MSPDLLSRRTIAFVNVAHALDHFVLLIYPTAVIAIAAERQLTYASLISLSTGAFMAFGVFSLPMGWLADRIGRRNLLAIFFGGCGIACLGLSTANTPIMFGIWLFVLGVFSAIYHPIGSTMLVGHTSHLGRDLGINGVWGNLGAALASGVTAVLAASLGWRAAFILPGLVCLLAGIAFIRLVPGDGKSHGQPGNTHTVIPVIRPMTLFLLFAAAIVAGGMTFNITTIALPKIIDERAGASLPLVLIGSLATLVFVFGALTQLLMGRLVDRYTLPRIFVGLSILQPLGLGLAALTSGIPMLGGLALAMAAIYGQVVANDAMVARYVPAQYRARAFSVRYFLGFTTSGLAVPLIALLHGMSGFTLVLGAAATFGTVIFLCSLGFLLAAQPPSKTASLPVG
ncbi:MFS transporter [Microvirga sp. BT689]|uniref:MFS transporter n=1 Tax=Microvirga arvi TaxID=2778731 RepID=UPI00194F861A|nr:MFS transporter [Microvirga arvi]MBM6580779.1 MFS transporter [Microvirga arvi]